MTGKVKSPSELRADFERRWGNRERAVLIASSGTVSGLSEGVPQATFNAWLRRGWLVEVARSSRGFEYVLGEVSE